MNSFSLHRRVTVSLVAMLVSACSARLEGPAPVVDGVSPQAACTEQLVSTIAVTGKGLSPLTSKTLLEKPELLLPVVTLTRQQDVDGKDGPLDSKDIFDDPKSGTGHVKWSSQTSMSFEVTPDVKFAPGLYSVGIKNGNGKSVTFDQALLLVPPPRIAQIDPEVICGEVDNETTLSGDFFLVAGSEVPKVGFRSAGKDAVLATVKSFDDCRALPGSSGIKSCKRLTVSLPKGALNSGNFAVEVTNPAPVACDSHGGAPATSGQTLFTVVPAPKLAAIRPDLVCTEEGDNALAAAGQDFLRYGAATPTLVLGVLELPTEGTGCVPVPEGDLFAPRRTPLSRCDGVKATLPKAGLAVGKYLVAVKNPAPAACRSSDLISFVVAPPPTVTKLVEDLLCNAEGAIAVKVIGSGFLTVDGKLPQVLVGATVLTPTVTGTSCLAVDGTTEVTQTCTELTVTIPTTLATGTFPLVVKNPETAACSSAASSSLVVVGKPTIISVQPTAICSDAPTSNVVITGTGFLTVGATLPSVGLSVGTAASKAFVPVASNCVAVGSVTEPAQLCTTLTITVPAATLTAGATAYDVTVGNPAPAACSGVATAKLTVEPPPTLTDVQPAKICSGGSTVVLTGTGFHSGARVTMNGIDATTVTVSSLTSATAEFGGGLPVSNPVGSKFDVIWTELNGCSATKAAAIEVISGPALFFADPSVVYNGVSIQATFYGTGFTGAVTAIGIRPAGSTAAVTPLTFAFDPTHANRVLATIPKGTAKGDYDVVLADNTSCKAVLSGGLKVVDTTTLTLTSLDPAFGAQGAATAVVVSASPTAGGGLKPVPRVYLTPSTTGGTGIATPLTSVAFQNPGTLTAIVPANSALTAGDYDLIVVNPDGAVGFLAKAFTVAAAAQPPPVITGISPGSIQNKPGAQFTIAGSNFRAPQVSLSCVTDAVGGTKVAVPFGSVTTSAVTGTSITATFDPGAYVACVVRVTNPDNKTFSEFSALVVTNPSQKLSSFASSCPPTVPPAVAACAFPGSDMTTARRGLVAVAGRVTNVARFLYALGGDDGQVTGALSSVESVPVDLFGKPGAWFNQPESMLQKRTQAGGVIIGRYIYMVGGNDGATPLKTVERTYVLDPAVRTEIDDLDLKVVEAGGLFPGVYNYRISAVMDVTDKFNPAGETLPSDSFGLLLPTLGGNRKVAVGLSWKQLPGAAGYRVYRTRPNDPAGTELLIGTTTGLASTTFLDDGKIAGTEKPLPIGATGKWSQTTPLGTARMAPGVTFAIDPSDATKAYLYALGGKDTTSTALKSVEFLTLTLGADGTQTAAATFTSGLLQLPLARQQLAAFSINKANAPNVTGATDRFIYAFSGVAADGMTMVSDIDAAKVSTGGQLVGVALATAFDAVAKSSPARAGYGSAIANNFLYTFGGTGATPGTSASQTSVCDGTCSGAAPRNAAPYLTNSPNSTAMNTPRYLMGSTLESAFIYILGGSDVGQNSATKSVELTIW